MCGNFCDLTEKRCKYESNCWCKSSFDIYDQNANPGEGWEWIAVCGGSGRWVEVSPNDEYWENYKKQYDKDPESTASVIEKDDFNKLMKEAEETVNNINFKSDNAVDESNCKSKASFDIYDRNANPGDDWEWNGGGCGAWDRGKWELKPQWKKFRDQTEKDPKSTAVVIEKEEFDKLMKEAEETVNNISFKSDNAANNSKTCENEGCKFCEFGPELCERFEEFDLMVGPQKCKHWQNKYSGEKYDKTPKVVTPEDLKKAEKEANKELENIEQAKDIEKQTIEHLQKGSANVIRRTYEKLAKSVGWDEPYETYMDRVRGKKTDLTKEQEDKLHKDELNSNLFKWIVAKFVGVADMHPNTFIDGYLMTGDEQIKAEPGQYCAYANKIYKLVPNPLVQNPTFTHWEWKDDTANIYLRTITVDDIVDAWMLNQCNHCNREKHCSDCRVHKVWVKDTEEGKDTVDVKDPVKQLEDELYKEIDDVRKKSILDTLYKLGKENLEKDTSYKHMSDEEMLEQLKKNAVDNIMSKLSGQVVDLVDDAMRTAMVEFERSKEVRDAYEDRINWSTELKPESKVEPDFMNQWVNDIMEKQAKQINISVVNEMLHQKEQFIKFLKECLKLDTYSDFMYKIENEIKSQENEINFYNSYLKQFYKNI